VIRPRRRWRAPCGVGEKKAAGNSSPPRPSKFSAFLLVQPNVIILVPGSSLAPAVPGPVTEVPPRSRLLELRPRNRNRRCSSSQRWRIR
jgi:hypothetical protein